MEGSQKAAKIRQHRDAVRAGLVMCRREVAEQDILGIFMRKKIIPKSQILLVIYTKKRPPSSQRELSREENETKG